MGIKEEIFSEFFSVLQEEKEVPKTVVLELKQLIENRGKISEEKILGLVARGCEGGHEDKKS